jgi:hypothetical protein
MKIGDGLAEPKKVRCTGCGMVILLTPNAADPANPSLSFPRKTETGKGMSESQRGMLLLVGVGVLVVVAVAGLWWTFGR